ncbi:hypothetical protein B0H66DRAFT_533546 [Apodospora peruviana]|uniref:Uncharacterized protein n=1 Tax=Apodospora peruviana TaxID=516989 RepID=A0AAE0I5M8_9PEZI|nr:hypothetical protein B0H66DRAFT_533546 [Apodospora peruviana]
MLDDLYTGVFCPRPHEKVERLDFGFLPLNPTLLDTDILPKKVLDPKVREFMGWMQEAKDMLALVKDPHVAIGREDVDIRLVVEPTTSIWEDPEFEFYVKWNPTVGRLNWDFGIGMG